MLATASAVTTFFSQVIWISNVFFADPRGSQRNVVYLGTNGGGGIAGSQPISTAVHMEPK